MKKKITDIDFTLIETDADLQSLAEELSQCPWMGIDTEFIGEKRFHTLICLVQISSPLGIFLIDSLQVSDLQPVAQLLENPNIQKLTHAGDNDYRLFYDQYGTQPKNLFDTQIAAGFLYPKYPMSFQKILGNELDVHLGKNYAISQWDARPLGTKQLLYAINDVYYLHDLYESMAGKLRRHQLWDWAQEEFLGWEQPGHFETHEHAEFLKNKVARNLGIKEQAFMLRLYQWRKQEARERNISKEMFFPEKTINAVAPAIRDGKKALQRHRRISEKVVKKHWDTFAHLYDQPIREEEKAVIEHLPKTSAPDKEQDLAAELIFWLIRYHCHQKGIAPGLVLKGSSLRKLKTEEGYEAEQLASGWRKELLGDTLTSWLENSMDIQVEQAKKGLHIWLNTAP